MLVQSSRMPPVQGLNMLKQGPKMHNTLQKLPEIINWNLNFYRGVQVETPTSPTMGECDMNEQAA